MTARLLDVDVGEETRRPERADGVRAAAALGRRGARRAGRPPVRLLIVPARNVVDAIVGTVIRLRSSDVYVGESSTLSADDQARLLGEAWERADKPEALDVRLVIYHRSGRADTYHLGAHPPSLTSGDLDLIHRLWLDAVKTVGPHVHHHDVVRAALTQMEQQLTGPQRDEALAAIREMARPADELAAVLRARDYARLRDMLRNRHAGDVAALLTALSLEDQVVVFRVLPRKDAAAVFEYLSQEAKEALLKAHGAGGRRGAAQQHGAGRPHAVPRGAAGRSDAPAAGAAHAGGAGRRADAARLSREVGRPADDAALRRGPRAVDRSRGARLRARARPGQRNAERHLRRRRAGPADRRHPHPRVPARAARSAAWRTSWIAGSSR